MCSGLRKHRFEEVKRHGGCMIQLGHVGLIVGPSGTIVPRGWVYLPIEQCEGEDGFEIFCRCLDSAKDNMDISYAVGSKIRPTANLTQGVTIG